MTIDQLVKTYPRLYHMAESGTWESILRHGLLSTAALLDLFEVSGQQRRSLMRERRPESVLIEHPRHGHATIRDNKVLQDHLLERCLLDGLSPADWYEMLNSRVFFWPTEERLRGLLTARPYRDKPHCVIEINTLQLIQRHESRITLSPINSGSTIFNPAKRGRETFKRISAYSSATIAEFAVDHAVPDLKEFVITVKEMQGDVNGKSKTVRTLRRLFSR